MWTVIGRKAFLVVTQLNGLKNPLPLDSAHAFDLAALGMLYFPLPGCHSLQSGLGEHLQEFEY